MHERGGVISLGEEKEYGTQFDRPVLDLKYQCSYTGISSDACMLDCFSHSPVRVMGGQDRQHLAPDGECWCTWEVGPG